MSTPTNQPFVITREQAPSFWQAGSLWTVLASGQTTGGDLTVMDQVMPARSGPPPHVHPRLHEYLYLLDGEIAFQLDQEVATATAGAMVSVPAGTVHAFAVVSQTARVLNLYTPGGFTEQISWLGTPAAALRLPEPHEQGARDEDQRTAYLSMSAELNTQVWLGPDQAPDLLADQRDAPGAR